MHLADAFIQSDLHCIQVSTFYQLLLSLGIEPMILALLAPCSTSWATGKLVGLMDRALDLKLEITQGCGFESRLRQEVHDCSPGAAQSAAHCSKCVHLDGLNAENTFHSSLYSV